MRLRTLFFMLALFFAFANAENAVNQFHAYKQSGKIVLEWNSGDEQPISYFIVQRSMDNGQSWFDLSRISPYGNGSAYLYIDDRVFGGKGDLVYYYRLKIFYRDGSVQFTAPVNVTLDVSSVQMTWGSIKAMFR